MASALAVAESDFVSPTQAVAEVLGRDARKVDREIAADKAREAALQPGTATGDIIVAEVVRDELEVAKTLALPDDDAVAPRKPMKNQLSRWEQRARTRSDMREIKIILMDERKQIATRTEKVVDGVRQDLRDTKASPRNPRTGT